MTIRYLKITQPDLQREFYKARQNTTQSYPLPSLSVSAATADLPGIRQALAAARHLLEMYRRQLCDDKARRRLQRLDRRLLDIAQQEETTRNGILSTQSIHLLSIFNDLRTHEMYKHGPGREYIMVFVNQ